jgi:hypothetical protein
VLSVSLGAEALKGDGTISVSVDLPVSTSVTTLGVRSQTDVTLNSSAVQIFVLVVLDVSKVSQSNDSTVLKTGTEAGDSDRFNSAKDSSENNSDKSKKTLHDIWN